MLGYCTQEADKCKKIIRYAEMMHPLCRKNPMAMATKSEKFCEKNRKTVEIYGFDDGACGKQTKC